MDRFPGEPFDVTETNPAEPRLHEAESEKPERPPSLDDFAEATEAEIAALPPNARRLVRAERAAAALSRVDLVATELTAGETVEVRGQFDKSDWGDGAWQTEPDLVMWLAKTVPHYRCQVSRNFFGSLSGYVAIPPGHPAHGVEYERIEWLPLHRALSFSGRATAEHWVFGFHCGSWRDVQPATNARLRKTGDVPPFMTGEDDGMGEAFRLGYRDLTYVRAVVEALAAALAKNAAAGVLPTDRGAGFDDDETPTEIEP